MVDDMLEDRVKSLVHLYGGILKRRVFPEKGVMQHIGQKKSRLPHSIVCGGSRHLPLNLHVRSSFDHEDWQEILTILWV